MSNTRPAGASLPSSNPAATSPAATLPLPPQGLRHAAGWMSGWLALMTLIAVAGREASRELDVFQIMLMRSVIGMAMLYPLLRLAGGMKAVRTQRFGTHLGRNLVHYAAQYGWFVAITLIPLTQVIAIEFTMPLWVALLAALFLGERLTRLRLLAVAVGLAGVMIIVRPTTSSIEWGQMIALASALGFAVALTLVKSMTRTETILAIIFWMLVIQSALGLVPALLVWQWPSATGWFWVLVIAFCGTYSHYCLASAMRHADATTVVPMDFLRVPLTAAAGWLVYSERIDLLTVVGTALILAANLLNLARPKPPA